MGEQLTQEKQAELQKEAEERIAAFEFGMELFFHDKGIEKKALAEIAVKDPAAFTVIVKNLFE